MHLLWQSAHVMMALDNLSGDVKTLYAVGIDGALCEPFCTCYFLCLGVKNLHEVAADDLSFLLRVGHTGKVGEELLAGIHTDDVKSETLIVVHHVAELVFSEHSVIDKDAGEVFANGTIEEHGSHRRVNAS